MIIEQHYDDEVLIGLLEEADKDAHVPACDTCSGTMESFRDLAGALHDTSVWDERELPEAPKPETTNLLRAFAATTKAEDAAAGLIVARLLAEPSLLDQNPQWRTAGVVRRLLKVVDDKNFSEPKLAADWAKVAVNVAESLDAKRYPFDTVTKLRATAWRELAYALYYIGSYNASLEALDRTDQLLSECAISDYDGARAGLVRAQVYGEVERFDAAIALAESARGVFRRFNDIGREAAADSTMGALLMHTRRFAQALAIQKSLAANARLDSTSRAFALHNTAVCHWELSQLEEAKFVFVQAIGEFERLGIATMRAKARWLLGQVLLAEQRYEQALTIFSALRQEFQDLGMPQDVALVSIDAAEALFTLDRRTEVVHLCQAAMEYFSKAGLAYTQGALTALAYLKEAAEARTLTPRALGDLRMYFELLPKRPELLFAYPA